MEARHFLHIQQLPARAGIVEVLLDQPYKCFMSWNLYDYSKNHLVREKETSTSFKIHVMKPARWALRLLDIYQELKSVSIVGKECDKVNSKWRVITSPTGVVVAYQFVQPDYPIRRITKSNLLGTYFQ